MTDQRTERTTEQARQARRGRPVLAILLASIALVVIAFGILAVFPDNDQPTIGAIESTEAPASTQSD